MIIFYISRGNRQHRLFIYGIETEDASFIFGHAFTKLRKWLVSALGDQKKKDEDDEFCYFSLLEAEIG